MTWLKKKWCKGCNPGNCSGCMVPGDPASPWWPRHVIVVVLVCVIGFALLVVKISRIWR